MSVMLEAVQNTEQTVIDDASIDEWIKASFKRKSFGASGT